MLFSDKFDSLDLEWLFSGLNAKGAPYGIHFIERETLSNSRLALQAMAFVKQNAPECASQFHSHLFKSYFTHGHNLGDLQVLLNIAQSLQLPVEPLKESLLANEFAQTVDAARRHALSQDIKAIPTFFFGDAQPIVGAVPFETFRMTLKALSAA